MQMEYNKNGLILKILDESCADKVLAFNLKNREFFEPSEASKPDKYYTLEFTSQMLRAEMNQFLNKKGLRFFVFLENNPDEIIGTVSFQNIRWGAFMTCHTGYKIDYSHCRKGYGYKALTFALDIICSEYGLHRIEAYIQPDNKASIALAKKVGFVQEGIAFDYALINGKWTDHLRYIFISAYQ